jgi:tetratricopeptide (TPR) repeat protein
MLLIRTIAALLLVGIAAAQSPIEDVGPRLNQLIDELDELRVEAASTSTALRRAESKAEQDAVLARVRVIEEKLRKATAAFVRASDAAKALSVRDEIVQASRQQDLDDAIRDLKALDGGEAEKAMPGLLRLHTGNALRLRGEQLVKTKRTNAQAIGKFRKAIDEYESALEAPDMADPDVGSSVHAASLRHLVQIHAMLFEAYAQQYRSAKNRSAYKAAEKHRKAGVGFVDIAKRLHKSARTPNGRLVLDEMENDVQRLTHPSPYQRGAAPRSTRGGRGRGGRSNGRGR